MLSVHAERSVRLPDPGPHNPSTMEPGHNIKTIEGGCKGFFERKCNPSATGAAARSLCRASVHLGQWLHKDIRPVPAARTLRTCLLWDTWFYHDLRGTEKRVYRSRAAVPCSCIPITEGLRENDASAEPKKRSLRRSADARRPVEMRPRKKMRRRGFYP